MGKEVKSSLVCEVRANLSPGREVWNYQDRKAVT
jgi:hypothetical protein